MKKLIVSFALMVITLASYAQVYKMYSTRNYHNQLRLNTMTGEVQQIQDVVSLGLFVVQEKYLEIRKVGFAFMKHKTCGLS